MNKFQIIVVFSFLLFSCVSGQTNSVSEYKIDESIKEEVNNNIENMNGVPVGNMEVKFYENDVLIFDNFGEKEEKGQFLFLTTWQKDTVLVIGFVNFASPISFYLILYGDNYELAYMPVSEYKVYKYNKQDTELLSSLSVPCSQTSCTLISKPTFKKEDPISGIIELKSNDFWQLTSDGEKKYRVDLKTYFSVKE